MTQLMYETAIQSTKQSMQMAVTKFMLSLLGWIGFPMLGISWFANMDNTKSTIIFIVSLCMVLIRFYYWIVRARQNRRLKDLEIMERERDFRVNRTIEESEEDEHPPVKK